MAKHNYMNDTPIDSPDDDRFGIDPFARAIAQSIRGTNSPVGATIAINGPWGSGKSSAVNLIEHHLSPDVESGKLVVINFKCWWFHGEEALTLAFLQELSSALEKNIGTIAKEKIAKLGKTLLRAGPVVGPVISIATGGLWGAIFGSSGDFAKEFLKGDESIENIFSDLSNALAEQDKRFLVIIDDIDRLTPDEALLIFRLVKSVGRLPNVLYLLVYDRKLAEGAVKLKYPSEGPHFLEKIIQANFELPLPARDDLNSAVLAEVEKYCGNPKDRDHLKRFMNIFYDMVSPLIRYPRDVTRLSNSIAISWPPVAGEVNLADYIALEILRLFEVDTYNAIRNDSDRICGRREISSSRDTREEDLQRFVDLASEKNREFVKTGIIRLFPRLENMGYGAEFEEIWEASRRICTKKHFDTYFRMSLSNDTLSMRSIEEFIDKCADSTFVREALLKAASNIRGNGKSEIPLLLDELNSHGAKIAKEKFEALFVAIFEVADEILREQDEERGGFSFGGTYLRIHWLIRKLTFDRCKLPERSKILFTASEKAQIGWLVDFVSSTIEDHHPRKKGEAPEPPEKCLVTAEAAELLRSKTIKVIQTTAKAGALITHPRLAYILFRWREFADDDGRSVKAWTRKQLSEDVNVALLARALTGESWSQSVEDRVSERHVNVGVESLDKVLDKKLFRQRLEEIHKRGNLESPHKDNIETFLDAWRRIDKADDD